MEDDGPDEAECEFWVAVHDVLSADVDQFDFFVSEEPERCLHVLDCVETHATALTGLEKETRRGGKKIFKHLIS